MDKKELILQAIDNLPSSDQEQLLNKVQEQYIEQDNTGNDLPDELFDEELQCPDCESRNYIKWGTEYGRQKYKCKDCERYFKRASETVFENIRHSPETVLRFIDMAAEGYSLRKMADKLGIALKTAFEWRHKFTEYLSENDGLAGIIEVDETYVPYSKKGDKDLDREPRERGMNPGRGISKNLACILTAKDQNDNLVLKVSGRARPSSDELDQSLSEYINGANTVLCTDGTRSYWPFCRENNLEHEIATSYNSPFTLNHINNLHKQLKEWLKNFNGVATKYLENYLQLFKIHKSEKLSHVG